MDRSLPRITLVRHGETTWALTGQHTGRSDPPLTENGLRQSRLLKDRLAGMTFKQVWSSPTIRARTTCNLAGFETVAKIDDDLQEWDYGCYNGLTSKEILQKQPGWKIFEHGSPDGESVAAVTARADRVVKRLRDVNDAVLIFSSGHFLRSLAARWIDQPLTFGEHLLLDPTGVCTLGYDHNIQEPGIFLWNETFGRR